MKTKQSLVGIFCKKVESRVMIFCVAFNLAFVILTYPS